jgi:hypothetical protein
VSERIRHLPECGTGDGKKPRYHSGAKGFRKCFHQWSLFVLKRASEIGKAHRIFKQQKLRGLVPENSEERRFRQLGR